MLGQTSNRMLVIGLGVSLLLHAGGAWAVYAIGVDGDAGGTFQRPEVSDPAPDPANRIELGDPESRAVSVSWLGFEEYQRHVAMASQVDQPDLTMDPASGAPGSAGSLVAARVAVEEVTAAARAEAQRALEEIAAGLRSIGSWARVLPEGRKDVRDVVASGDSESRAQTDETARRPGSADQSQPRERVAQQEESGDESQNMRGQSGSGVNQGPAAQRPVEGESGLRDDRESDATSVDQSELGNPGKPLAARGLRIRTVRPRFSHYTSIMTSPRDPVVRIHFDASGRARKVDMIEPSGNPDIDRPVLDAVYRWTATGESLKGLGESETVTVDVRILL